MSSNPKVRKPWRPEPVPAPVMAPTRYRCRLHEDEMVTWRGRGCKVCAGSLPEPVDVEVAW